MKPSNLQESNGKLTLSVTPQVHKLVRTLQANFPVKILTSDIAQFSVLYYCYLYVNQNPNKNLGELLAKAMASLGMKDQNHLEQFLFVRRKFKSILYLQDSSVKRMGLTFTPEVHELLKNVSSKFHAPTSINTIVVSSVLYYAYLYEKRDESKKLAKVLQSAMVSFGTDSFAHIYLLLFGSPK